MENAKEGQVGGDYQNRPVRSFSVLITPVAGGLGRVDQGAK